MSDLAYDFAEETADCEGAEDFLDHFGIPFDPAVVHVYRLHILQRFHDYVAAQVDAGRADKKEYRRWLVQAYDDFVHSDAQTEKVFKVFQRAAGIATVSVASISRVKR